MPPPDTVTVVAIDKVALGGASLALLIAVICAGYVVHAWIVKEYYNSAMWFGLIFGVCLIGLNVLTGAVGFVGGLVGGLIVLFCAVVAGLYAVHHLRTKTKATRRSLVAVMLAPTFIAVIAWGPIVGQVKSCLRNSDRCVYQLTHGQPVTPARPARRGR